MRPFLCGLTVLLASYYVSGGNLPAMSMDHPAAAEWRRTMNGWENARYWQGPVREHHPPLRPELVAAFQLMASMLALLAAQKPGARAAEHRTAATIQKPRFARDRAALPLPCSL